MANKPLSRTRQITFSAVCLALCVILPYAFHAIPNAAEVFCPMHIPVLLCALACGWQYGLVCGIFGPLLCFITTGMPTATGLLSMIGECSVYGVCAGLLMRLLRNKSFYGSCYTSLVVAMIVGRVVGGFLQAVVIGFSSYPVGVWATSYFVKGWPAIVIQLVFIPNVLFTLAKTGLLNILNQKQSSSDYVEEER